MGHLLEQLLAGSWSYRLHQIVNLAFVLCHPGQLNERITQRTARASARLCGSTALTREGILEEITSRKELWNACIWWYFVESTLLCFLSGGNWIPLQVWKKQRHINPYKVCSKPPAKVRYYGLLSSKQLSILVTKLPPSLQRKSMGCAHESSKAHSQPTQASDASYPAATGREDEGFDTP